MEYSSIAMGQINTTIGDFEGNADRIVDVSRTAKQRGADLVCFPELAICGYPPQDLLERPAFLEANRRALEDVGRRIEGCSVLVGYAESNPEEYGKRAHNAVALIEDGEIRDQYFKQLLPTYDVFDEARHFEPGEGSHRIGPDGNVAVTICEDIWNDPEFSGDHGQPRYEKNPLEVVADSGADVLINVSASPFVRGKDRRRTEMIRRLAEKYDLHLLLCNLVGGNDSLIFDGNSVAVNPDGDVLAKGAAFEEDLSLVRPDRDDPVTVEPFPGKAESVYRGLTLGLSDYLGKCGFDEALVGLSGGMDSTLTATLAVDALGPSNVHGVLMPSEITSAESVEDAQDLAENLGIDTRTLPIKALFDEYLDLFSEEFAGLERDHTEENLQARIRGNILMALSNKYGDILLTTGNKSELAVGYCTLYGDMNGGLAVISDVPKTMVYELAEYRNTRGHVIPRRIFEKPPSAELAPDQEDEDELPPYSVLDDVLEYYVEDRLPPGEIIEKGYEREVVEEIVELIDLNEYKRQQAPIGLKVTSKSFTMGWHMPIAQHFEG